VKQDNNTLSTTFESPNLGELSFDNLDGIFLCQRSLQRWNFWIILQHKAVATKMFFFFTEPEAKN